MTLGILPVSRTACEGRAVCIPFFAQVLGCIELCNGNLQVIMQSTGQCIGTVVDLYDGTGERFSLET